MLRRIFIAINLPEEIKKELMVFSQKWPELKQSARWIKKENFHLTLLFLGLLSEKEIFQLTQIIKGINLFPKPFFLKFKKICYGPPGIMPSRLIWLELEKKPELLKLVEDLQKEIIRTGIFKKIEKREFSPHISLARIRAWEWRRIEPEERPEIEEEFNLEFKVDSIQIMESKLKRSGAEYSILENISLSP